MCQTCELAAQSMLQMQNDPNRLKEARRLYRGHLWADHHNPPIQVFGRRKPSILKRFSRRIVTGRKKKE